MSRPKNALFPMGYLLSWRTYGTWLPGDARGWNARPGDRPRPPSPALEGICRERMRDPPLTLTVEQRAIVEGALRETCAHHDWPLHALTIQDAHVHVVASAMLAPERVVTALKFWASRRLRLHHPELVGRTIWERHASTRYLFTQRDIFGAVDYVLDEHHTQ